MQDKRLVKIMEDYDKIRIGPDESFQFHCDCCGKCCINREDILLNPFDVYRMAKALNITAQEVAENYCDVYLGDTSKLPILRLRPRGSIKRCPFLENRRCSINDAKPTVCALFPLGRMVRKSKSNNGGESVQIQYVLQSSCCGDKSQTHTVREWVESNGIPVNDPFFLKWQEVISPLSAVLRKAVKRVAPEALCDVFTGVYVKAYLAYDTAQDFLPQFEKNANDLLEMADLLNTVLKKH